MADVSAVLFAKDHAAVARFYQAVLGVARASGDDDHSVLDCNGFELVVHQIPARHLAAGSAADEAPARRGNGAIRLDFLVRSIDAARDAAARLGGTVDDAPPGWARADANFYLGHDPEGNVFKLSERSR